jgi:CHAT domain-containing protein/tetratricopeptide (TPR) repeat protein
MFARRNIFKWRILTIVVLPFLLLTQSSVDKKLAERFSGESLYSLGRWIGDHGLLSPAIVGRKGYWAYAVRNFLGESSARTLEDRALLAILSRRPKEAANLLHRVSRESQTASIHNNLAIVYWTSAESNPASLLDALIEVDAALRENPRLEEALFNRALILEGLSLGAESQEAWKKFLAHGSVPWTLLARQHLSRLLEPTIEEKWEAGKKALEVSADLGQHAQIEKVVSFSPQHARIFVQEDLMPRWASARLAGRSSEASRVLRIAREIGLSLVKFNGDRSAGDMPAEAERAELCGQGESFARGVFCYRKGSDLGERFNYEAAMHTFHESVDQFSKAHSISGALWAKFEYARALYYAGDERSSEALLDLLEGDPHLVRYPALKGRIFWAKGVLASINTHFEAGLLNYRMAADCFRRIGEAENRGAVEALLAENLSLMGNEREAWLYRLRSLRELSAFGPSVRLHNILVESADKLVMENRVGLADPFVREGYVSANSTRNPVSVVEMLLLQSRVKAKYGRRDEALSGLSRLRHMIARINTPATRQRLYAEVDLAEGEFAGVASSLSSLPKLSAAIAYYESHGLSVLAAYARLLRSRSLLLLGDSEGADVDLEVAIAANHAKAKGLVDLQARLAFQRPWDEVFQDVIRILIDRNKEEAAFSLLERRRVGGRAKGASDLFGASVRHPGVAILSYVVLRDKLVVWILQSGNLRCLVKEIDGRRLEGIADDFFMDISSGRSFDQLRPAARTLFDLLVRPVLPYASHSRSLVFVADGVLSRVPFEALLDDRGRFLIETFCVQRALGASTFLNLRRASLRRHSAWNILAVGNPSVDRLAFPSLIDLPGALIEAREVAALYSNSRLLLGRDANPEAFLDLLRDSDIIHFAGHAGVHPADPGLSRLYLSAYKSPGHRIPESVVYARDLGGIMGKVPSLFVLSACTTYEGVDSGGGGSGLAGALLDRGVSAVVVTQWKVDDEVARKLFLTFHREFMRGARASEALRAGQLALLKEEGTGSPFLWAAFNLFGEIE